MHDISYVENGHVGVLTLNRPHVHNALRHQSYAELTELVRATTARALVITGAGRSFCSGDDVREVMGGGEGPALTLAPKLTEAAEVLLHTDIPIIAAINGAALGWGMELALMADIRVAARSARFGELFVKRGICSDVAGLGMLAQAVGREQAAELLFTGEVIDAERAERIGLVGRVVDDDQLLPTALALAERIAANPPLADSLTYAEVDALSGRVAAGFHGLSSSYSLGRSRRTGLAGISGGERRPAGRDQHGRLAGVYRESTFDRAGTPYHASRQPTSRGKRSLPRVEAARLSTGTRFDSLVLHHLRRVAGQ